MAAALLHATFDHVIPVDPISRPVDLARWPRFDALYRHWIEQCFTKLHALRLVAYRKVLFLDADMLCLRNPDRAFRLPCPFGTLADQNKGGRPSGERIGKEVLLQSMRFGYGISGACFCVAPSLADFERALARVARRIGEERSGKYFETRETIDRALCARGERPNLNAGPDEQLVSWLYYDDATASPDASPASRGGLGALRRGGPTAWTNLSRQYNCVPWLRHKFERGDFAIACPREDVDREAADPPSPRGVTAEPGDSEGPSRPGEAGSQSPSRERPVFIIHYVTEKPWATIRSFKAGAVRKMWPDTKLWYDAQIRMLEHARGVLGESGVPGAEGAAGAGVEPTDATPRDSSPPDPGSSAFLSPGASSASPVWPGTGLPRVPLSDQDFDLVIERVDSSACFMTQQEADAIYARESYQGRKKRPSKPDGGAAAKRRRADSDEGVSIGPGGKGGQAITLLPGTRGA